MVFLSYEINLARRCQDSWNQRAPTSNLPFGMNPLAVKSYPGHTRFNEKQTDSGRNVFDFLNKDTFRSQG